MTSLAQATGGCKIQRSGRARRRNCSPERKHHDADVRFSEYSILLEAHGASQRNEACDPDDHAVAKGQGPPVHEPRSSPGSAPSTPQPVPARRCPSHAAAGAKAAPFCRLSPLCSKARSGGTLDDGARSSGFGRVEENTA